MLPEVGLLIFMSNNTKNTPLRLEKSCANKEKISQDGKMADWIEDLYPVEEKFIEMCKKKGVNYSFDMTARENFYYETLNYTTYGKSFIMHPLQPELAMKQTYDAIADVCEIKAFSNVLKQRVKSGCSIKWNIANEKIDLPSKPFSVIVLPGENKIKEKVCIDKLRQIEKKDKLVIYKPHPFTNIETLKELAEIVKIDNERILPLEVHLHSVMTESSKVYTTHLSESCAYAVALKKPIEPIDIVSSRELSSFVFINYHLFFNEKAWEILDRMFSSPKSGIIDLELDKNWEEKMEDYFQYTLETRQRIKDFYVQ